MSDELLNEMLNELLNEVKGLHKEIDVLKKKLEEKDLDTIVYDTKELARVLGISKNYAGMLMAKKTFPSTRMGGKWKISKEALDLWLRQNQRSEIEFA